MSVIGRIRAVLIGNIEALGATVSGIAKRPTVGPQRVEKLGIVGDHQADLRVHGGADKAVHCYPWSHYESWSALLPDHSLLSSPGAFGENLSIEGIDERDVFIADRWRVGSAVLEVSQGRQPCFKLNVRFGHREMARAVQDSLRAGWYLRVLEPGYITAGDTVELLDRPHPSLSLANLLALIRDRETRRDHLEAVLRLPLTPSWRKLFEKRMTSRDVEQWDARMAGS